MADEAHKWTDGEIERLEKRFMTMYRQASKEMGQKVEKLMEGYDEQRREWLKMVRTGEKTQQEYKEWLRSLSTRHRYVSGMADTLARDATRTNELARDAINDALPRVFTENANRAAFSIEKQLGWDTHSFDLVDESTVRRLMAMPDVGQILKEVTTDESIVDPPLVTMRKLGFKEAKDVRWNRQKFNAAITQGILQGESIPNVAKRLKRVLNMGRGMAVRAARTAITSAENAGRVDSYKRAKDIGIELEQQWVATLDERTRESHRHLDGEHVAVGKKFSNGLEFPGDPEGRPEEVWNCRCTLVAWFPGIEQEDPERWSRLPDGMTYEEWKSGKLGGPVGRNRARRGGNG